MSTSLNRRAFLRAALAAGSAGAVAVLAGCESAVRQAEQAGTGSGESGGRLVIGSSTDVDPKTVYSQSITSMTIGLLVWDTLIRYDHRTLTPTPSVATSWDLTPDGLSMRLVLRDDVHFHSGRRLTSEDVAYAVRTYAAAASASQLQSTAAAIREVDTSDPGVAVLHFARPIVNIFDLLEFMLLTDSESGDALTAGDSFVGTGPFRVTGREVGSTLNLARNDRYWAGPATIDAVTLRVVRDPGALLTSVRARQSDLVLDASPQSLRPFRDEALYRVQSLDVDDVAYYVGVNVADERLGDKRVRQAISYAVDRQRIVDEVLVGRGIASSAPWARTSPAFTEAARVAYDHDPDRARSLLDAAGWRSGDRLLLSYGSGSAASRNIAAIVQNDLAGVGVTVTLDPREQASYNPFLKSGDHQLWISPHGFGQSNPATLATGAAPFKPAGNLSGFTSADYTAAVARFTEIVDPTSPAARAVYRRYTDILLDEQFLIDLAITSWTNVSPARVSGLRSNLYKYIDVHGVTVR
ncbi:ABC transporter substrate-binding protein [Gordonia soli]|uniref:Putative peptide ABC transporter substrate-binding protein n=1 Tax=Gordonia soli NBRC 108243 TaxID=1223545 RepID=M0QRW2_9ACTN|nr:ABC transporter substrate-binding protein [Gordonia soli]GAC70447.1 putative peptide ABC transporter substrate-binding protein [Gordonia soli NBRC 108243]